MAKHPDREINPGIVPGKAGERNLSKLKTMIREMGPPTFRDAQLRFGAGPEDTSLCQMVGAADWEANPSNYQSQRHAITLAFAAYWEMVEER